MMLNSHDKFMALQGTRALPGYLSLAVMLLLVLTGPAATAETDARIKDMARLSGTTAEPLLGRPGNNPYCHHRALELAKRGLRERLELAEAAPDEPFAYAESFLDDPLWIDDKLNIAEG